METLKLLTFQFGLRRHVSFIGAPRQTGASGPTNLGLQESQPEETARACKCIKQMVFMETAYIDQQMQLDNSSLLGD